MASTLGFTSMDPATETALRAAFDHAIAQTPGPVTLAAENAADYVIVDMDSMYGPMGWLRLHAAGKKVVGLTSAARTQADFRLGRPFDTDAMRQLLDTIAQDAGTHTSQAPALAPQPAADPHADAPPAPEADATALRDAPAQDATPPQTDTAPATAAPADAPAEAPAPVAVEPPVAPPAPASAPEAAPAARTTPDVLVPALVHKPVPAAVPTREPVFADWMRPGALTGHLRYQRGDGAVLWIDADARQYYGPAQLRPLTAYFTGTVERDDFAATNAQAWAAGTASAGTAQPLMRLQWFGGLLAGAGQVLPGFDPDGRYVLTRWPETEREYPRHFRIATAMMKGPATLADIAQASQMPLEDVTDFLNAHLATGHAVFVPEPTPEPEVPAKPAGFFARLRGRG